MAKIDINPAVLNWAMRDSSVSITEIAAAVSKSTDTVSSWLSGQESLTKGDLEKVAKRLHRPVQLFFLPKPPVTNPFPVNRRSALAGIVDANSAELAAYREANRLQSVARWVVDQTNQTQTVKWPALTASPEIYAGVMHVWLEWDLSRQIKSSKGAIFRLLREAVEATGAVVLLKDVGEDRSPGFSLPDERVPTIVINSNYQLGSVRSFTLLHELAHLARGDSRLHHESDQAEERWCERFAASFLIPEQNLRQYLSKGVVARLSRNNLERVRLISNRYGASWKAVAIRLVHLGLADASLVTAVQGGEKKDPGGPGGEPRTTAVLRIEEFGAELPRILAQAKRAKLLPELDVLRYLRVSQPQFNELLQLSGDRVD